MRRRRHGLPRFQEIQTLVFIITLPSSRFCDVTQRGGMFRDLPTNEFEDGNNDQDDDDDDDDDHYKG